MLHSENVGAVCTALSMYQVAASYTRLTGGNPLEPMVDEVRQVARALLRRPPRPGGGQMRPGADHVSALNVLTSVAEVEDADLIADVLEGSTDVDVRATGLLAAAAVLTKEPDARLVDLIGAMVLDETLGVRERRVALTTLGGVGAPEVDELLVRATESTERELQTAAALQLATPRRIRTHRDRLERLVESWPEDAGGDARLVRDQLARLMP